MYLGLDLLSKPETSQVNNEINKGGKNRRSENLQVMIENVPRDESDRPYVYTPRKLATTVVCTTLAALLKHYNFIAASIVIMKAVDKLVKFEQTVANRGAILMLFLYVC